MPIVMLIPKPVSVLKGSLEILTTCACPPLDQLSVSLDVDQIAIANTALLTSVNVMLVTLATLTLDVPRDHSL